ncbi:MAG: hypothetical protein HS104_03300 [Polyangiaceae bacterium]|nr:hypothetical protein [Polyangiaceae bacterium]MBE7479006.1 hypothetical protein [Polyangiaceae bacterium]MCL4703487.1 hypothetical protein [Burkholderiaceae bacterium]
MALGPHVPEWAQLQQALAALAHDACATSASVLDAWGLPWCCAPHHNIAVARDAARSLRRALASLDLPLQQGGSLDRLCSADDAGVAYVRSFATVYVLVLRYDALPDLTRARRATLQALPQIEALVEKLPPPAGPGSGSAEALGSA